MAQAIQSLQAFLSVAYFWQRHAALSYSWGMVIKACLLLLIILPALVMLTWLTECACLEKVVLWGMRGTWKVLPLQLLYTDLFMTALTP